MKKKLCLLIVLVLILSLAFTGCGKKDPTPAIKAQVTGLLDAMVAGDVDTMETYVDPSIWTEGGDLESFATIDTFADELVESIGTVEMEDLSEDALAAIEKFKNFVLENLVESYEIGDITVDGDSATVEAVVNYGFDPDQVADVDVNADLESLLNDYMANNMEDLISVLNNEGEDALQIKILNDLIGDILDLYSAAIIEQGGISEDSVIFLDKVDGNWTITGFLAQI